MKSDYTKSKEELNFSIMDTIMHDFYKKSYEHFDTQLKEFVTSNLKKLGFNFKCESDFIDFVSKRVTRVSFENKPNEYEIYIDYQTEGQKLIGCYSDKVSFSFEESKVTVTFGSSILGSRGNNNKIF